MTGPPRPGNSGFGIVGKLLSGEKSHVGRRQREPRRVLSALALRWMASTELKIGDDTFGFGRFEPGTGPGRTLSPMPMRA